MFPICAFAHMKYNFVIRVFTVVFLIFLGAILFVASLLIFDIVSRLIDTRNGPSLSTTSGYGQTC